MHAQKRESGRTGGSDLRIIIMGGSGADDAVRALNILRGMSDIHPDSLGNQLLRRDRRAHIGAGDLHAHALEHQANGTHGHTADANQMHMTAGDQILGNGTFTIGHIDTVLRQLVSFHNL